MWHFGGPGSPHCSICSCPLLAAFSKLSFGGIPLPGKPGTFLRKNFQGCMENLYYNGVNVIDLAKRRKPQIYSVVGLSIAKPIPAPPQKKRPYQQGSLWQHNESLVAPLVKHGKADTGIRFWTGGIHAVGLLGSSFWSSCEATTPTSKN